MIHFSHSALIGALVAVNVGFLFRFFFNQLPFPYSGDEGCLRIPQFHLDFLPGGQTPPDRTLYDSNDDDNVVSVDDSAWLGRVRRLFEGEIEGVESVAYSPMDSSLVLLDKYGYVHKAYQSDKNSSSSSSSGVAYSDYELDPPSKWTPMYIGPGRPLGYHVIEGGRSLLVCDSLKGLIKVNLHQGAEEGTGRGRRAVNINILANEAPKMAKRGIKYSEVESMMTPINYANDVDVGPKSGFIYFSSSTEGVVGYNPPGRFYDTLRSYMLNFFRGDRTGRLLRHDPSTGITETLLDGLFYANGVAVADDESYVLVVETTAYRVLKLWLKDQRDEDDGIEGSGSGAKAGEVETFVGRLPGAPDGISRSADGKSFWLCLVTGVSPLHKLGPYPWLRRVVANLIIPNLDVIAPKVLTDTAVLRIDNDGNVIRVLLDRTGQNVKTISAATEAPPVGGGGAGAALFLGALSGDYVSVLSLDEDDVDIAETK